MVDQLLQQRRDRLRLRRDDAPAEGDDQVERPGDESFDGQGGGRHPVVGADGVAFGAMLRQDPARWADVVVPLNANLD
ncbi:hypothetical protein [Belnapia moabensis]|uniref:hypothetical protein n=1 Tax=Belnapia moabensis TaxID=365533 RepID=UPI0014702776|nr:hypothetical protein [Belnapia moabensis]